MQSIYPEGTRSPLEVFCLYDAEGEYFDISNPAHIIRDSFVIGSKKAGAFGYFIGESCVGCGQCAAVCPQQCIDFSSGRAKILQNNCLHCGNCKTVCAHGAVIKRG